MVKVRDAIIEVLREGKGLKLTEIAERVHGKLPDVPKGVLRWFVRDELYRLRCEGKVERENRKWKLVWDLPDEPNLRFCFKCGEPLEGKMWHKCKTHNPPTVLIKWNGVWLPFAYRELVRKNSTYAKPINRCEFCGNTIAKEQVPFTSEVIKPQYNVLFPVQCESCGETNLVFINLYDAGLIVEELDCD